MDSTRLRSSPPPPAFRSGYAADAAVAETYVDAARDVLSRLPTRPDRTLAERATADRVQAACRAVREEFLQVHVAELYNRMTAGRSRFVRLEELVLAAAARHPWLVPDQRALAGERRGRQADKEGHERDQAILVAAVLDVPELAEHLVRAMLRPTPEALGLLDRFRADGQVDLGFAQVRRQDGIGHVTLHNDRYLNAEDDAVVAAMETAVDLVLLDDGCQVGVLRGGVVSHPRYAGRRIFNAGINLTHLYQGEISFIGFLMRRELGPIHKIYRGHWLADRGPGAEWKTREKPWIGAVDTFAIGGGLQILLVTDRIVADSGVYFSLPAMREGIVPGSGNLRLPRFVGDRLARQLIFADRRIGVDEPEAMLLCDVVVEPGDMDAAIAAEAARLVGPAVLGNRRMTRLVQEPIDLYRRYLAAYAREQSDLLHGEELVRNLERAWLGRPRGR